MRFDIYMKDPDAQAALICDSEGNDLFLSDLIDKYPFLSEYFEYGEYAKISVDTEAKTCTLEKF